MEEDIRGSEFSYAAGVGQRSLCTSDANKSLAIANPNPLALPIFAVCAPLVLQKLVLCIPVLHGRQGSLGEQIEWKIQGHTAKASSGAQSKAPRRS